MPPKKSKEEKKTEETKEEIGVFVFPDGSRYDGQFIRQVTIIEDDSNDGKGDGKGGNKNAKNSNAANNNNANNNNANLGATMADAGGVSLRGGGAGENNGLGATNNNTASPTQLLIAEYPEGIASALTPTISTVTMNQSLINQQQHQQHEASGVHKNTSSVNKQSSNANNNNNTTTEMSGATTTTSTIIFRQGNGIFQDGNTTYDGTWNYDRMHGFGRLMTNQLPISSAMTSSAPKKYTYVGYFRNNEFDGKGTYNWPDGSSYEGSWRANKQHGEGIYCDVNGNKWKGRWYDGVGSGLVEVEE